MLIGMLFLDRICDSSRSKKGSQTHQSQMLQIAFIALSITLINLGSGRHIEYIRYVLTESQSEKTETLDFAAHLIYTTALFVCRLSGVAFYHRLCELHDSLSVAIKCTTMFLVAAYLPQMALIVFHCNPVTGLWPYSWQEESMHYTCLGWGLVYLVNSALSLVCDIFMFTIPVALINVLKLPLNSKLRLYLVLLPGLLQVDFFAFYGSLANLAISAVSSSSPSSVCTSSPKANGLPTAPGSTIPCSPSRTQKLVALSLLSRYPD